MHPSEITHIGTSYTLGHMAEQTFNFDWTVKKLDNARMTFAAFVQYAPHCYSETAGEEVPEGAFIFTDRGERRVFSPIRHAQSMNLPSILKDLFDKPTSVVELVPPQNNWSIFRTDANLKLDGEHNYRLFFRLYVPDYQRHRIDPHPLRLFVLTAYQSGYPPGSSAGYRSGPSRNEPSVASASRCRIYRERHKPGTGHAIAAGWPRSEFHIENQRRMVGEAGQPLVM